MWVDRHRQEVEHHRAAQRAIREARQETADFFAELDEQYLERQINLAQRQAAAAEENKANEIAKARADREQIEGIYGTINANLEDIGGSMTQLAGTMIKHAISGADQSGEAYLAMLDAFLEATAIEYTLKGIGEIANAAIAFARQDYVAGPQHLIGAGLAFGVAAATGIGAAAIPSQPTGGGGSGGGAPATAQQAGGGGGGPVTQNVTIQLFAPQAVFTEAERGTILASGMRAARRELGPASVRT
jgi:hypothetical protein